MLTLARKAGQRVTITDAQGHDMTLWADHRHGRIILRFEAPREHFRVLRSELLERTTKEGGPSC